MRETLRASYEEIENFVDFTVKLSTDATLAQQEQAKELGNKLIDLINPYPNGIKALCVVTLFFMLIGSLKESTLRKITDWGSIN